MKINRLAFLNLALISLLTLLNPEYKAASAQQIPANYPADSILSSSVDSTIVLRFMIEELHQQNAKLLAENAALLNHTNELSSAVDQLKAQQISLINYNDSLNMQVSGLGRQLRQKNEMLESQLRLQKEKEQLFAEKEQLYKEAVNSSIIDKVKLEGQISAKDTRLEGKEREISLLQLNIDEKNRDIGFRNAEIQKIITEKQMVEQEADSLRNNLTTTEKSLILRDEQLKYTELKLKDCESRYSSVTNKKKKTKVVQGFAIKNYRTPDYVLAPKDAENPSVYVISNDNTSNIEFDFITGASIMLKDLSKPNGTLTYDVGFFLGFGGNNLFKNFYIGPNFKLFDLVHVNIGANVAEYKVLKDGFSVGDALPTGIAIPTTSEWKINAYFGLAFDLELITMIGKK